MKREKNDVRSGAEASSATAIGVKADVRDGCSLNGARSSTLVDRIDLQGDNLLWGKAGLLHCESENRKLILSSAVCVDCRYQTNHRAINESR